MDNFKEYFLDVPAYQMNHDGAFRVLEYKNLKNDSGIA